MLAHNGVKRPVENFIVAAPSTTLRTTGVLNDNSTGNVNLANGQIGFVGTDLFGSTAAWNFLPTSMTIDNNPTIALFQGTAASASVASATATYPLGVRPYERTGDINGRSSVYVTKQPFRAPQHSLWSIGATSASAATAINVLDETLYGINVAFRSRRFDEQFGYQQSAVETYTYTTPDYSNLPAITDPIDDIVHQFAWRINRTSGAVAVPGRFTSSTPVLALCVGMSGGTQISTLTVGASLSVVNTSAGVRTITLTQALLDTINDAATATGFTHIHINDLATAGVATGGVSLGLWIIGMDSNTAFVDYIIPVKTRVQVGLPYGFATSVASAERSVADEGQGQGRVLDLMYKATQGQRTYNLRHTEDPVITYPSPVNTAASYVTYAIHHGFARQIDIGTISFSPMKEYVLIPSSETTLITNFETGLNTWLQSGDNQPIVTLV